MKRIITIVSVAVIMIVGLVWLKYNPSTSLVIWNMSREGTWLLPLVFFSSLLDSIHPCSFSILLLTIAFLFAMQLPRKRIIQIGGVYIVGIFAAYFLIGLGILKVLHLFNTPHFMGRLGASLLVVFGIINLLNYLFPSFPIKLRLPRALHESIGKLMYQASIPTAFALGILVGICQFPCMGGPYLMVIGLLHDQVTYWRGVSYLMLYNVILIIPLIVVLLIAADKTLVDKIGAWRRKEMSAAPLWAGIIMIIVGLLIFLI
ncbi:MAG: cytochrome c biogenesis protein CcdA [Patescibacteria group bacterium]